MDEEIIVGSRFFALRFSAIQIFRGFFSGFDPETLQFYGANLCEKIISKNNVWQNKYYEAVKNINFQPIITFLLVLGSFLYYYILLKDSIFNFSPNRLVLDVFM